MSLMRGNRKPVREDTGPRILAVCHVCETFLIHDVFFYVFLFSLTLTFVTDVIIPDPFFSVRLRVNIRVYRISGDESNFL